MKQGKTEKAVFAKLSKVELEQHDVTLSKVQDIRALEDKANEIFSQGTSYANMAGDDFKEAEGAYERALKEVKDTQAYLKEVESNGIGVRDIMDAVNKFESRLENMLKKSRSYAADAKAISKF